MYSWFLFWFQFLSRFFDFSIDKISLVSCFILNNFIILSFALSYRSLTKWTPDGGLYRCTLHKLFSFSGQVNLICTLNLIKDAWETNDLKCFNLEFVFVLSVISTLKLKSENVFSVVFYQLCFPIATNRIDKFEYG